MILKKSYENRTIPEFRLLRLWSFHFARRTSVIPMGAYKISIANLKMQTMQNSVFSHTGNYLGKCQQKDTMFRRNNNSFSFVNLKFSPEIPLPRRPWCHVIGH